MSRPQQEGGAARYDGFADWYEAFNAPHAISNRPELEQTLGAGDGLCLDLGCGTGLYFDAVRATGRVPIGLDLSADQLRWATHPIPQGRRSGRTPDLPAGRLA